MRSIIPLLTYLLSTVVHAQALTLDSAIAMAVRHLQYSDSRAQLTAIQGIQDKEVKSAWFPEFTLKAQSTIQNEQFDLPFTIPGVDAINVPLGMHRVLVEFSQLVYDGQMGRKRIELDQLSTDQQGLALDSRKLELRAQVTQCYMSILLGQAQQRLLMLRVNTLSEQHTRLVAAADAGAVLGAEVSAMEAEQLTAAQEQIKADFSVQQLFQQLALLTGDTAIATARLTIPTDDDPGDGPPDQRPDVRAFDLRLKALDVQSDLAKSARLPQLRIFGNAGAGDPGYNILLDEWRPMFLIGAGLQWPILDNGTRKRTDRILDLQRLLIQSDKDRLTEHWSIRIAQQRKQIEQYRALMTTDQQLVKLREEVAATKADQLAAGTITTSEYIADLNKEQAARLGLEIHELQTVLAIRTTKVLQAR